MGFCFAQLNLTAGEELEIEYEVDGWFHVRIIKDISVLMLCLISSKVLHLCFYQLQVQKKRPGRDGKISGLVPVLYITS